VPRVFCGPVAREKACGGLEGLHLSGCGHILSHYTSRKKGEMHRYERNAATHGEVRASCTTTTSK
jgi:hypothetical protein